MKYLVVIDMQNDFITGSLANENAMKIIPNIKKKLELYIKDWENFETRILFTKDKHDEDYLETEEGINLPVPHCIKETFGRKIIEPLSHELKYCKRIFEKNTFGSVEMGEWLRKQNEIESIESVELIGVCTGICVISNAILIKSFLPNIPIYVDASCCACVTPESHKRAIEAMKMLHIHITNEQND